MEREPAFRNVRPVGRTGTGSLAQEPQGTVRVEARPPEGPGWHLPPTPRCLTVLPQIRSPRQHVPELRRVENHRPS